MDRELRRLRDAVSRNRGRGEQRPRFPEELRKEIAAFADGRSRDGDLVISLLGTADDLGLAHSTLLVWVKTYRANKAPRLRSVEITESVGPDGNARPVLVLPDGTRVENLELNDLLTLLRGLR